MSYNGSGTFVINTSGQPVVTGTVISSTAFNALTADLGTGLSTAITKDGQTATTARIPFAAGINSTLVTDSASTVTGSIITAGGVGVAKALFVGTTANVAGAVTLQSTVAVGGVATYSAQPIFSSLTASSAVATDASKGLVSVTNTGTGNNVLATSPTLVTPALGTPSALVGTNITGTATAFTASNVTTNANLTGDVTSVGNATTLTNAPVIAKVLTGYVSGAGTVAATDSILQAIQKLNGNAASAVALSYVRVNTANGYGSTNNKIRRFTNTVNNVGSDITYADSATLGATFTINTAGVYSASFSDQYTGVQFVGLSINSTQLTTAVQSIAVADILSVATTVEANAPSVASATFYAAASSVVRAHTGGGTSGANTTLPQFTIARVA